MKAFHSKQEIKDKVLAQLQAHHDADEISKGIYWENGKGCGVGCTVHSGNRKDYETQLGIPRWLAHLEDRLFQGMPDEDSKKWPLLFSESITPGQDLDKVKAPFLIFVLDCSLEKFDHCKYPKIKQGIDRVIDLYRSGGSKEDFKAAADAAVAAANDAYAAYAAASADAAAASAAAAADVYAAAADAASAAATADAATSAAYAYADADAAASACAAQAAACAAASAAASAAAYARRKEYKKFSKKLIQLLRECG